ncbi:DNA (cytosine-5-)-methyltransferase [uncultured Duncaniella sp.]|uniref:DNA (cytosine-5-)-methyltransferase n=1 Tax=uncultured Duncaniella sp. TaxID=2768039 RepID=UPI00272A9D5F|nr:DNA (cytosine-5-)-methyltransferase [uncultured Duncaniella sp.]
MSNHTEISYNILCEPLVAYSKSCHQPSLFPDEKIETSDDDFRVIELFAGVGGFRIGLERASSRFKTVWNNQWEPSTKRQDASQIYCKNFGFTGHSNIDISTVPVDDIPNSDILVGGFPCQDYSVATTLKRSEGIEGKKGVLWWQIHRILKDHPNPPKYLVLENVDRLLGSPASQRGRDFAIILASLSDLGYCVEWRIINAAEYGMPQRRRRTYMFAFKRDTPFFNAIENPINWLYKDGVMANSFPVVQTSVRPVEFTIIGDLSVVSEFFNKGKNVSPFKNTGVMINRKVFTIQMTPSYNGPFVTLGDLLVPESEVPNDFFISDTDLEKWQYVKGGKTEKRVNKATGFEYNYSEGAMSFPDSTDKPSRTIITGEGGNAPSRFKHVILTASGRYRRLIPIELERLNMFPDNHTEGASDMRRAFLMGNALVTGIVERIGLQFVQRIKSYSS